jgi:STAT protein, protein interaction domain
MALWAKILQQPSWVQEKIRICHSHNFSFEVRQVLADWIEERLL